MKVHWNVVNTGLNCFLIGKIQFFLFLLEAGPDLFEFVSVFLAQLL
jgi:hypothetical protein